MADIRALAKHGVSSTLRLASWERGSWQRGRRPCGGRTAPGGIELGKTFADLGRDAAEQVVTEVARQRSRPSTGVGERLASQAGAAISEARRGSSCGRGERRRSNCRHHDGPPAPVDCCTRGVLRWGEQGRRVQVGASRPPSAVFGAMRKCAPGFAGRSIGALRILQGVAPRLPAVQEAWPRSRAKVFLQAT